LQKNANHLTNNTKSSTKQVEGPQQNWGQNKGLLAKGWRAGKQRRKLVTCISRRESYLSSLCIYISPKISL